MKKNKSINHNHGGYYKILYHYGCNNNRKSNGRTCDFNLTYNQEKLDAAVFEIVGRLMFLPEFKQEVIRQLGDQDEAGTLEAEMRSLRKRLNSEELKKRKLGENLDALDIFDEGYDRKYDDILAAIDESYDQIEKMEVELKKKKKKLLAVRGGIRSADRIINLLDHMKELYNRMSCEERRKMYRLFIERIEVYPERPDGRFVRQIVFKFPIFYGEEDLLTEKKPDEQIGFVLDCHKLEITAAEAKATYAQIKSFIWEQSGVKVSSLYVAQIKKKYGLDLGRNYNLPKNPNARVPKCPRAKEELIVAALKHYRMLDRDVEVMEEGEAADEA